MINLAALLDAGYAVDFAVNEEREGYDCFLIAGNGDVVTAFGDSPEAALRAASPAELRGMSHAEEINLAYYLGRIDVTIQDVLDKLNGSTADVPAETGEVLDAAFVGEQPESLPSGDPGDVELVGDEADVEPRSGRERPVSDPLRERRVDAPVWARVLHAVRR